MEAGVVGRRRAVLEDATAVGDSVIGRLVRTDSLVGQSWERLRSAAGQRAAIAVSRIRRVEVRELDKSGTYAPLIVIGIAAGATLVVAVLLVASLGGS